MDKFGEVMLALFPSKDEETKTTPECPVRRLIIFSIDNTN